MGKVINMVGQKIGRLTVLEQDFDYPIEHQIAGNKAYWRCKCDCGNVVTVRGQSLRQQKATSCGCWAKEKASINTTPDMTGQRYGKLTVIKRVGSKNNRSLWRCSCDCGKEIDVPRDSLIRGNTKSCGCIISNGENIIAHILDELQIPYQQQYTFSDLKGLKQTALRFDFAIFSKTNNQLLCLLEFQGEQHFTPRQDDSPEDFAKRQLYDQTKRNYCNMHSIPLFEINYQDRFIITKDYIMNLLKQDETFDWS